MKRNLFVFFPQPENFRRIKLFVIYLSATLINRAVPFLLLPVITRYLSPAEYGTWTIFSVLFLFMTALIGMNSQVNITRNFFRKPGEEIAKIVGNGILAVLINSILVSAIVLFSAFFTSEVFGVPTSWVLMIPPAVFAYMILQYRLNIFRNQNKAVQFGVLEIAVTMAYMAMAVFFVVWGRLGWKGMALGRISSAIIFGVFSFFSLWFSGFLILRFDRKRLYEIYIISLPMILHILGGVIIRMSDKLFINSMVGKEAVGIYAVGYTFGMIVMLFTEAFNKSWSPWMYKQLASINNAGKKRIVRITYIYYLGVILLALSVYLLSPFMVKLMTPASYHGASKYVFWIALAFAVDGMYQMHFPYLVHEGKTSFLGIATISAGIFNLFANYFLIRTNGPVGAAQATFLAFFIRFMAVKWYGKRIFPMPWKL